MYFLRFTPDGPGIGLLHVLLGASRLDRVAIGTGLASAAGGQSIGGGMVMVDPILLNQSVLAMTETLAALLAAIALLALTRRTRQPIALGGVANGRRSVCVLCRPAFLVWLLAATVCFRVGRGLAPFRAGRRAGRERPRCSRPGQSATDASCWAAPVVTTTHGGVHAAVGQQSRSSTRTSATQPLGQPCRGRADPTSPSIGGRAHGPRNRRCGRRYALTSFLRVAPPGVRPRPWPNIRARAASMFAWSCVARAGRLWNVLPHQTSPDESAAARGLRVRGGDLDTRWSWLPAAAAHRVSCRRSRLPTARAWGTILVLSSVGRAYDLLDRHAECGHRW